MRKGVLKLAIKDWEIVIDRQTSPISQAGFSKPLILSTEKDFEFKTFTDVKDIVEDFDESTETYKVADRIMGQSPRPSEFAIVGVRYEEDSDEPETLVAQLNKLKEDYFFLVSNNQDDDVIEALVEWVESEHKMYGFSTDNPELVERLSEMEYDNSFTMLHEEPESYPAEGLIGACASYEPGSITWNFKKVSGVAPSGFDAGEIAEINGNVIMRQHGQSHSHEGVVLSGEYIDVIQSEHFIYARVDESVFMTLLNAPKVPFDNTGISMIEASVESPLKQAAQNGMIAEEDGEFLYEVSAPRRSEVSVNDRANRHLPGIVSEFEIAGAIHGGKIRITIKA